MTHRHPGLRSLQTFSTLVAIALAVTLTGCGLTRNSACQNAGLTLASHKVRPQSSHIVYVTGHGWHTGLVLRTEDVPANLLPEVLDFQGVEFGWGDEGFYRAKTITPGPVAKAALVPTPSVLHLAGFNGRVEAFFTASDLVELSLGDEQFEHLCEFLSESFDRTGETPDNLGEGLYGRSRFYRANGSYYFPKTCNVWTAQALKTAGLPTRPATSMRTESVLRQSRKIGRNVQKSASWGKRAALTGDAREEACSKLTFNPNANRLS